MDNYIVYVQTDGQGRIVAVNSSAFLPDATGWVEIDRGQGDRYHHAQGHYLPGPTHTAEGIPRYKLADGVAVERTAAEITADVAAMPPPPKTELELLQEGLAEQREVTDALTVAVLEGGGHA